MSQPFVYSKRFFWCLDEKAECSFMLFFNFLVEKNVLCLQKENVVFV